jgi:diacylglycerol kinase (ATP)
MQGMFEGSRRLILNPSSGSGDHGTYVTRRAEARGFDVVRTEGAGDAVELAREALEDGVVELAVCGGDGTVNEALRGIDQTGDLDEITFAVIPAGTANILAGTIGITDIDHGLEIIDTGRTRTIDLGLAGEEPFLVSCIAGLPADASVAASSDLKARFGTLAFLVTGAKEVLEFDGVSIEIRADTQSDSNHWTGEALAVLVGNARRFIQEGGQAHMEDGQFDVTVVKQMPAGQAATEAAIQRLLGRRTPGVTHFEASELEIASQDGGSITFSRDGELTEHEALTLSVRSRALEMRVGPTYVPDPR